MECGVYTGHSGERYIGSFVSTSFHAGLAHVCVVTSSMTLTRARIEIAIPRKRKGSVTNHEKVRECGWVGGCLMPQASYI